MRPTSPQTVMRCQEGCIRQRLPATLIIWLNVGRIIDAPNRTDESQGVKELDGRCQMVAAHTVWLVLRGRELYKNARC